MRDSQTKVVFDVYESDTRRGDCLEGNWAKFGNGEVQNGLRVTVQVPPQFLGRATAFCMWVDLRLDCNGILEITVTDLAGNKLGYASSTLDDGKVE